MDTEKIVNIDQITKINTVGIYDSVRLKYESSLDMEIKKARGMSTFNTMVIPLFMGRITECIFQLKY